MRDGACDVYLANVEAAGAQADDEAGDDEAGDGRGEEKTRAVKPESER